MKSYRMKNFFAFTLVEMMAVLIIVGILSILTLGISGAQIAKIENRGIKESILTEWQSRYSMNVGSSSFAGNIYDNMDIHLSSGNNKLEIGYYNGDNTQLTNNQFSNKFVVKSINSILEGSSKLYNDIIIRYNPYNIKCIWGTLDSENNFNVIGGDVLEFTLNINNQVDYCFEINKNNCRLVEKSCN